MFGGVTYPQYPAYQYPSQNSQQNNGIIWVQGEAGAKSYLVAPNTTVPLWDSESQVIYLKSADVSGMPSIKILDYTIRNAHPATPSVLGNESVPYATKDDLKAIYDRLAALEGKGET